MFYDLSITDGSFHFTIALSGVLNMSMKLSFMIRTLCIRRGHRFHPIRARYRVYLPGNMLRSVFTADRFRIEKRTRQVTLSRSTARSSLFESSEEYFYEAKET